MKHLEKHCLSCKHFRLKKVDEGVCRLNKAESKDYPVIKSDYCCEFWVTCGQQYYIRAGWQKKQQENPDEK